MWYAAAGSAPAIDGDEAEKRPSSSMRRAAPPHCEEHVLGVHLLTMTLIVRCTIDAGWVRIEVVFPPRAHETGMTQSVTIRPVSRRMETRPISGGHTAECRAWLSGAA